MKDIKILGPGCARCKQLEKATRQAVANLGLDADISKVTALPDIVAYGVMSTPGLVVDGEVVSSGQVLKSTEIEKLLS